MEPEETGIWNVVSLKELHDRDRASAEKLAAERDLRYQEIFRLANLKTVDHQQQITELRSKMDLQAGSHKGSDVTMSRVIASISVAVAVMTLVLSLVVLFANGRI